MIRLFGQKLRYTRQLYDLTQGELASYLFLASYTYINRLEGDQRSPSLNFVVRLSMLLGLSTDYFLRDNILVEDIQATSIRAITEHEVPMQLLGVKLRTLRLQKGLTQTELTHQLSLKHPSSINNLEAGRKAPSLELTVQIADLFGISTDYLLLDTLPVASYQST